MSACVVEIGQGSGTPLAIGEAVQNAVCFIRIAEQLSLTLLRTDQSPHQLLPFLAVIYGNEVPAENIARVEAVGA